MKRKIRLILTKKGYNALLKIIKEWDKNLKDIVINDKTCKFFGNIVLIKWDDEKRYKIYQSLLIGLRSYNITYRLCVYDEGIIQMIQYTEARDIRKNIPMPCVKCSFQDERTEKLLSKFQKDKRKGEIKDGV